MKKIVTILGTRPEIIKMSPIVEDLDRFFKQYLIFSGQHYDTNLVDNIFKDLELRKPDYWIKVTKKLKFIEIQLKIYEILKKLKPSAVIYHGDTLTTLACSLICRFFFPQIKRIHIEGGYRSGDKNQSEEIIRFISDHISNLNFVSRDIEKKNIIKEYRSNDIYIVGNSINEAVLRILKKNINNFLSLYKIKKNNYIYCTIHRQENVDDEERFFNILKILKYISNSYKVIFAIHPRTKKKIKEKKIKLTKNIILIKPVSYSHSINLILNSYFCFSDSGGIQEECVILKKHCLVPSDYTPHNYYIDPNSNWLLKVNSKDKINVVNRFIESIRRKRFKKYTHVKKTSVLIRKELSKNL